MQPAIRAVGFAPGNGADKVPTTRTYIQVSWGSRFDWVILGFFDAVVLMGRTIHEDYSPTGRYLCQ
jgi:hypothetical protein